MSARFVMTLVLATVLTGSAGAQDPQAVEVEGPSAEHAKRSVESTSGPAADSTKEAGDADLRKRPARKLTVQQKRIFVLGLWAAEKK